MYTMYVFFTEILFFIVFEARYLSSRSVSAQTGGKGAVMEIADRCGQGEGGGLTTGKMCRHPL